WWAEHAVVRGRRFSRTLALRAPRRAAAVAPAPGRRRDGGGGGCRGRRVLRTAAPGVTGAARRRHDWRRTAAWRRADSANQLRWRVGRAAARGRRPDRQPDRRCYGRGVDRR